MITPANSILIPYALCLVIIASLPGYISSSHIFDYENSASQTITAATHDHVLILNPDSQPSPLDYDHPETTLTFSLSNLNDSPIPYNLELHSASDPASLCSALTSTLTPLHSPTPIYSGLLSGLTASHSVDPTLLLPPLNQPGSTTQFSLSLNLPANTPAHLQYQTCTFNLVSTSWQDNFTDPSEGFSATHSLHLSVSTQGWIAINDIFYQSDTSLGSTKPFGQWIELYNPTPTNIDLDGSYLTNSKSHTLTISTHNSDSNLNPFDSGETTIPSKGYLTVFTNNHTFLDPDTDTLSFYRLPDPLTLPHLHDLYTYQHQTSSLYHEYSLSRLPDGFGDWYQSFATLSRGNITHPSLLDPFIRLYHQVTHHTTFGLFDAANYTKATYKLTYQHIHNNESLNESITGSFSITSNNQFITNLFLGTVSDTGPIPHQQISNLSLSLKLSAPSLPDRIITTNLSLWP